MSTVSDNNAPRHESIIPLCLLSITAKWRLCILLRWYENEPRDKTKKRKKSWLTNNSDKLQKWFADQQPVAAEFVCASENQTNIWVLYTFLYTVHTLTVQYCKKADSDIYLLGSNCFQTMSECCCFFGCLLDSFGSNHFFKSYILLISQFVH